VTAPQRPLDARTPAGPSALEERVGGLTSVDSLGPILSIGKSRQPEAPHASSEAAGPPQPDHRLLAMSTACADDGQTLDRKTPPGAAALGFERGDLEAIATRAMSFADRGLES
jgi:hypothetical protein